MRWQTNGAVCDYEDLLARVIYTQERTVKPSAWNATLDIGDAVRIPVSGYVKVTFARLLHSFRIRPRLLLLPF